jgi:hypothetical protein
LGLVAFAFQGQGDKTLSKLAVVHDFSLQLEELSPLHAPEFYRVSAKPHKHLRRSFPSQDRRAKLLLSCCVYQRSRLSGSAKVLFESFAAATLRISVFGHIKRLFGPPLAAPMVMLGICEVAIRSPIDCSDGIPRCPTSCSQYAASDVDGDRNGIFSFGFQHFDQTWLMENLVTPWGPHIPETDSIGIRIRGISLFNGSLPGHQEGLAATFPATNGPGGQHCDR